MNTKGLSKCRGCNSSFIVATMATVVVAMAIACGAAGTVRASTINVELGTDGNYAGTGAAPDTGTIWNQVYLGPSTTVNPGPTFVQGPVILETSTGVSTAVTFSVTSYATYSGTTNNTPSVNPLLNNYNYIQPGWTNSFTIAGLAAGSSYDLYLYGTNGQNGAQPSTFTIGSTSLSTTAGISGATSTTIPTTDNGISYVEFTGLNPVFSSTNNDFEINGNWTSPTGTYASFNGLQLVTVPEPDGLGLTAIGALGLLLLKRRKAA